jgi:pyridoxal phosphate enzyme (YggS family)
MNLPNPILSNINAVQKRIRDAELAHGRVNGSVKLLAVSKTKPASAVMAALTAGQRDFGESYLQDAAEKIASIADPQIVWHFIGPVQSNKTRDIANRFDWLHSLDRAKIAQRLNNQRDPMLPPLNVCIQVNVSGEATKAGIREQELADLAEVVAKLPGLKLRGLMTIPSPSQNFDQQRLPFRKLRELSEQLNRAGHALDTLSMGMSDDLEAAVAEGATIVRIGTAIFGQRN